MSASEDPPSGPTPQATLELADTVDDRPATMPATDGENRTRGTRIGRYEIEAELGAGGMGVVYAAIDTALGRRVALKLLHPRPGGDPGARLLREAQALAKLSHPNVVTVFDVGAIGDEVHIALELVEGASLRTWSGTRRDPARVLDVLLAAGRGLAAAHAAGIVHRDVKPDNILVGDDGAVRVSDFGLARSTGDLERPAAGTEILATTMTRSGAVMGTPAYMAPEQLDGIGATPAADQFSFCVTAYEALTGVRPFAGDTVADLRAAIERQALQPPASRPVDRRALAALARGLRVDPAARYPSMSALLTALAPTRRARWIAAGVALVALGGGVALVASTRRDVIALPSCTGPSTTLAATWNPARVARLRAAIAATGVPYADTITGTAVSAIERWAGEWTEVRAATCRAGGAGDVPPAVVAARTHCLDEQRIEAEARLDALAEVDRRTVEHALTVSRLPPPSACADVEVLVSGDEGVPLAVRDALSRRIARGRALAGLTRIDDAIATQRQALRDAEAAGARGLATSARIALADALMTTGSSSPPGEAALREGHALAMQGAEDATAFGRDVDAATAWQSVVFSKGRLDRIEGVEEAIRSSRAAARRTGSRRLEVMALRYNGSLLASANRADEGLAMLAEAIALAETLPADDPELLRAEYRTVAVLAARGHYEEALTHVERAATLAERLVGADHPLSADVVGTKGALLAAVGRTDEANVINRRVHEIYLRSYPADSPEVSDSYQTLGGTLAMSTNPDERREGLALLIEAVARVDRLEGANTQRAALFLAALADAKAVAFGDHEAAIRDYRRAVEVLEGLEGANNAAVVRALFSTHTNWGNSLGALGRCTDAIPHYDAALTHAASEPQRRAVNAGRDECLEKLGRR